MPPLPTLPHMLQKQLSNQRQRFSQGARLSRQDFPSPTVTPFLIPFSSFFSHHHLLNQPLCSLSPLWPPLSTSSMTTTIANPYWSRCTEGPLIKIDGWRIVAGEESCPTGNRAAGWNKRCDLARAELLLHVLCGRPKEDLRPVLFRARGQAAVPSLRRRFNTMECNVHLKLKEWIAEVEILTRQLSYIGHPIQILDIHKTLIRNLPIPTYEPPVYLDSLLALSVNN
jgi:hypothetical protein